MNRLLIALLPTLVLACGDPASKEDSMTNGATNGGTNGATNGGSNGATNSANVLLDDHLYVVMIASSTTAPDACFVSDPGPDIFGVGLEDATGTQLGWAEVVWDEIQAEGNEQSNTSLLNGSAPDLGVDLCPEVFDENVVSLGCNGAFFLARFLDANVAPVGIPQGSDDHLIRVYEWGGQCTTGTIEDTYDVSLCSDTEAASTGDTTSCDIQILLGGSGETSAALVW